MVALSVSACTVTPDPLTTGSIARFASTKLANVTADQQPVDGAITLYEAMARHGLRPARAVQRLSAVALDATLAAMLEAEPGAPGLRIVRVGYAADGRAVEYTRSTFRGDRWDFVAELS